MATKEEFEAAVKKTETFTKRPGNDELLKLYGLFKQSTEGDITGERPGGFDFKAIAKYDAWADLKGKSNQEAMDEYVNLVNQLEQQYA